jgi:Xaa-Pro aminopeptidase
MMGIGVGPGYIEQPPFLSAKEEATLETDMVITLEIGTYVNGFAAFQIEDEILVTDDGYELLTSLTRELVEL